MTTHPALGQLCSIQRIAAVIWGIGYITRSSVTILYRLCQSSLNQTMALTVKGSQIGALQRKFVSQCCELAGWV
jgi:hypothetical protein